MSERISKRLLLIEAVIFLAPVSAVTGFYSMLLIMHQHRGSGEDPWLAHVVPAFTFLGMGLQICAWRLIAAFITDGRAGIRRVSNFYIYAVSVGAALAVMSGLVILLMVLELELPELVAVLLVNYVAIPALIPFLHVMVERWMSRRADVSSADVGRAEPRPA